MMLPLIVISSLLVVGSVALPPARDMGRYASDTLSRSEWAYFPAQDMAIHPLEHSEHPPQPILIRRKGGGGGGGAKGGGTSGGGKGGKGGKGPKGPKGDKGPKTYPCTYKNVPMPPGLDAAGQKAFKRCQNEHRGMDDLDPSNLGTVGPGGALAAGLGTLVQDSLVKKACPANVQKWFDDGVKAGQCPGATS